MTEPLLTPEQIAELVGMSYHGVLRDIRAGKLRATKKGKGYHVTQRWFNDWLEQDVVVPLDPTYLTPPRPRHGPATAGSVADLEAIEQEEAA